MSEAPTGTLTLVFTDVQGSTQAWEAAPDAMLRALRLHDALLRALIHEHGGYEVKTEGDAFMVAFSQARAALAWALDVQRKLPRLEWPHPLELLPHVARVGSFGGLRVRIGLLQGCPSCQVNPVTGRMDYFGQVVNRAARLSSAAHGGQTVLTPATLQAAGGCPSDAIATPLGALVLKGTRGGTEVVQLLPREQALRRFPPLRSAPVDAHGKGLQEPSLDDLLRLALEHLFVSAEVALLQDKGAEGVRTLNLAEALLDRVGSDEARQRVYMMRSKAHVRAGAPELAQRELERAMALARQFDDPQRLLQARLDHTQWLFTRGRFAETERAVSALLPAIRSSGRRQWLAVALNLLAASSQAQDRHQESEPILQEALEHARATGLLAIEQSARLNIALAQVRRDPDSALPLMQELLDDPRLLDRQRGFVMLNQVNALLGADRPEQAVAVGEALDRQSLSAMVRLFNRVNLTVAYACSGEWGKALDCAERSLAEAGAVDDQRLEVFLGALRAAAQAQLGAPVSALPRDPGQALPDASQLLRVCAGLVALGEGRVDRARTLAQGLGELSDASAGALARVLRRGAAG